MGLSFAIPIDVAMDVRDQLLATGHVTRGRIGVTIQNVDGQLADSFGLDRPRGALVSSVVKDGPSAKAGVRPGDVILQRERAHRSKRRPSCRPSWRASSRATTRSSPVLAQWQGRRSSP